MKTSGLSEVVWDRLEIGAGRHRATLQLALLTGKPKARKSKTEWTCFQPEYPRAFGSPEALRQHCNDTGHQSAKSTARR